jgi:hypothetical protein
MGNFRHPAAFCKTHGLFPATAFAMEPGAGVTILGCSTNCPICNATSEVLPGTYSAFQDRVDVLLHPSVSKELLAALTAVIEAARDNRISEQEARKQADKIVPGSGRLFDIANWSGQAKATLYGSIIGAIAMVAAAKIASSPSQTVVLQPVIERVAAEPKDRGSLPGLPGGPPLKQKHRKHH